MTGGPCSVVNGVDDQASGRLGLLEVSKYWSGVVSQSKSSSEVGKVEESSLPLSVRVESDSFVHERSLSGSELEEWCQIGWKAMSSSKF